MENCSTGIHYKTQRSKNEDMSGLSTLINYKSKREQYSSLNFTATDLEWAKGKRGTWAPFFDVCGMSEREQTRGERSHL